MNAIHVALRVRQLLLDLALVRTQQRFVVEALGGLGLGLLSDRRAAGCFAHIALQSVERQGAALGIHVVFQQGELAAEDQLANVLHRQHVFAVEIDAFDLLVRRFDHDLQVLPCVGAFLCGQQFLQFHLGLGECCARAFVDAGLKVRDFVVVAGEADLRGKFRRVVRHHIEQHLGIGIAAFDPFRRFGLRVYGTGSGQCDCDDEGETFGHGVGSLSGRRSVKGCGGCVPVPKVQ